MIWGTTAHERSVEWGNAARLKLTAFQTHSAMKGQRMSKREYKPVVNLSKLHDLTGRTFGQLTVVRLLGTHNEATYFECRCDCGVITEKAGTALTRGQVRCRKCYENSLVTHGLARRGNSVEYETWRRIKERCLTVTSSHYRRYGGRGIMVCGAWIDSVSQFVEDVGTRPTPTHSIDRIDNNGHYSCGKCPECIANGWPMNVRWATVLTQANNRRSTVFLTLRGITKPRAEWARELSIPWSVLRDRTKLGWTDEEALTTPLMTTQRVRDA